MAERARVACPQCGAPMNLHAEKVDCAAPPSQGAPDRGFGGTLSEFHTCPNPGCRFVLERPAATGR